MWASDNKQKVKWKCIDTSTCVARNFLTKTWDEYFACLSKKYKLAKQEH